MLAFLRLALFAIGISTSSTQHSLSNPQGRGRDLRSCLNTYSSIRVMTSGLPCLPASGPAMSCAKPAPGEGKRCLPCEGGLPPLEPEALKEVRTQYFPWRCSAAEARLTWILT